MPHLGRVASSRAHLRHVCLPRPVLCWIGGWLKLVLHSGPMTPDWWLSLACLRLSSHWGPCDTGLELSEGSLPAQASGTGLGLTSG